MRVAQIANSMFFAEQMLDFHARLSVVQSYSIVLPSRD